MITTKVEFELPVSPTEVIDNGTFENVTGDNFVDWGEIDGTGTVRDETTMVHAGSHSVKITAGTDPTNQPSIYQNYTVVPGSTHRLTFWSRGAGEETLKYRIYDNTNAAYIRYGTGSSTNAWKKTIITYEVPAGCVHINIGFYPIQATEYFYLDDVSILQYSSIAWTENTDVMATPSPSWGYGIKGNSPMGKVADTGVANITLDNFSTVGKYSPGQPSAVVGFEEGMDIRISLLMDTAHDGEDGLLDNGGRVDREADYRERE